MMKQLIPEFAKVLKRKDETSDTFSIVLETKIKHDPGQFVELGIPGIGEAPISIASYSKGSLTLTIRKVGNVTNALAKVKKGDKITVRGPYGKGYPMDSLKGNSIVIIGGGCGVAPLKCVIDFISQHRDDYDDIHLFLGYRSPSDILYEDKLAAWKKDFKLTMTVDKNPGTTCYDAKVGFVTDAVKEKITDNDNKVVFLCGPPIMITNTIKLLKSKGFHDDQMFISEERLMHCGIGICCHCMIHEKFTCMDGPVFRYDEIKDYHND